MRKIYRFLVNGIKYLYRKLLVPIFRHFTFRRLLLGAGILLVSTAAVFYVWMERLDISKLNEPLPSPTFLMDRYGDKASQISSSKITPAASSDIPEHLKKAFVAVEDRRFYSHSGVDPKGTLRALFRNAATGGYAQGGSTITQQLAKNVFLQSDKKLMRKIKEWAYAWKLESTYDKDEILTFYLNRIYFGDGTWGIQSAAKHYFAKEVRDLSLEESALLAALPKAPTRYSPAENKSKALERRNLVLSLMRNQGYLNEEQAARARSMPIVVQKDQEDLKGRYPSYVDAVFEEAVRDFGFTEEQLLTGGFLIFTQLDPVIQQAAESTLDKEALFPESSKDQIIQAAAVVLDQQDGGIRGLVGNRGESVFRGFNRATQMKRQPGSTFKPLAVYGPALEKGYRPESMLEDRELNLNGYRPENYDHLYRGAISMQDALVQSLNVPAVWLLNRIGVPAGSDFVRRAGIPLDKRDEALPMALGGLRTGVTPLQMAQAYSAFPRLGTAVKAHAITKITTADGKPVAERKPESYRVTDPQTAYTVTLMLQDAVARGTGKNAALTRPTAGKSGTTQLPETKEFAGIGPDSAKDAWFVGYTPELTAAVWIGYDETDANHYLKTTGGAVPALLFKDILSQALSGVPPVPFSQPPLQASDKQNPGKEDKPEKEDQKEDQKEHKQDDDHPSKGKGRKK